MSSPAPPENGPPPRSDDDEPRVTVIVVTAVLVLALVIGGIVWLGSGSGPGRGTQGPGGTASPDAPVRPSP